MTLDDLELHIDMTIRPFVRPLWALRSSRPIKTTKRKAIVEILSPPDNPTNLFSRPY